MTVHELMSRVEKGAAWLDVREPGWFDAVDLDLLDLPDDRWCILGQVCGSYNTFTGLRIRAAEPLGLNDLDDESMGFDLQGPRGKRLKYDKPAWDMLRECWITAILTRRHAALEPADPLAGDRALEVAVRIEVQR